MTTVPVAPQVPTRELERIRDPLVADVAARASKSGSTRSRARWRSAGFIRRSAARRRADCAIP